MSARLTRAHACGRPKAIAPHTASAVSRRFISIEPAVGVSIFDGGRLRAGVNIAESQQRLLVEQYKASVHVAVTTQTMKGWDGVAGGPQKAGPTRCGCVSGRLRWKRRETSFR